MSRNFIFINTRILAELYPNLVVGDIEIEETQNQMVKQQRSPVFFHREQLEHKPRYEWAFGEKIDHPETTHRAESILRELLAHPAEFAIREPLEFPLTLMNTLHNPRLVQMLKSATSLRADETFSPSVFPYVRQHKNIDVNNIRHAGAFCFDSGTPLTRHVFPAAAWSAACGVAAAKAVHEESASMAYGLCRPPGHHATKDLFGGYCYFNNAALAASWLSGEGRKVAILDIDFHHGNGSQSLFYDNPSVQVVNIHGDPNQFYPYFTGYREETGQGHGRGFNLNLPLQKGTGGEEFIAVLNSHALEAIEKFQPDILIVSAGLDTYVSDPIGAFCLQTIDFGKIGSCLGNLGLPLVVIQEGGYHEESLGRNVHALLSGIRNEFELS